MSPECEKVFKYLLNVTTLTLIILRILAIEHNDMSIASIAKANEPPDW